MTTLTPSDPCGPRTSHRVTPWIIAAIVTLLLFAFDRVIDPDHDLLPGQGVTPPVTPTVTSPDPSREPLTPPVTPPDPATMTPTMTL